MGRKVELENIIIGTLLDDVGDEYYIDECRSCITKDMFSDQVNKRIYDLVMEQYAKGEDTTPLGLYQAYGQSVVDIIPDILEKVTDYSFTHKKSFYNKRQWLAAEIFDIIPQFTDIQFSDYVNAFVQMSSL